MRGRTAVMCGMLACAHLLVTGPTSPSAGLSLSSGVAQDQEGKPDKADRLEAKAMKLLAEGDTDYWAGAAKLLEESARLRPEASLTRATSLKLAANLFCWAGFHEQARALFQESAEQAFALGEMTFAAHTYLDAAVLSADLQMGRHTVDAARMAERIAASPDLSGADRDALRSRLDRLDLPMRLAEIM